MFKKIIFVFFLLLISVNAFSEISNLEVNPFLRLGENLTISGSSGNAIELCKFLIKDENDFVIERLSDEYTFADGSFYAERQLAEPPYYRGDDYNVVVTCGTSVDSNIFTVLQPLGVSHSVQMGWEYWFSEPNQDAIMLFGTSIAVVIIILLILVFFIKRARDSA